MRSTVVLAASAVVLLAAAAPAHAGSLVFVCGQDLCSAARDGAGAKQRLTRDGARSGAYASPSVALRGNRIAFTRGERGRVFTAALRRRGGRIVGLRARRRIPAFRDGPRDATQFDVALSRDGRQVLWVELRINVVFDTIDYRRYAARFDGAGARQVASSGGRPFAAWAGDQVLREGLTVPTDERQTGEDVDQGLCTPSAASGENGTCRGDDARQLAFDPSGRHLRHPDVAGRLLVATAYAFEEGTPDSAIQRPGAIALFDTATGAPIRDLTRGPADSSPVFAPDARRVAFERGGAVWTVPVAGGQARRVLRGAREPAWSR